MFEYIRPFTLFTILTIGLYIKIIQVCNYLENNIKNMNYFEKLNNITLVKISVVLEFTYCYKCTPQGHKLVLQESSCWKYCFMSAK